MVGKEAPPLIKNIPAALFRCALDGRLGAIPFRALRDLLPPDIFFIYCWERSVDYPLCYSLMGGKWHREKDLSCFPAHIESGGRQ